MPLLPVPFPRFASLSFACLLLAAAGAHAEAFRGVVSHVTEADTIWVRPDGGGDAMQIHFLGLDAPENCQVFGPRAKKAVREHVLGHRVLVRTEGIDEYGRHLAHVRHGREDLGAWLVANGFAWSVAVDGQPSQYRKLEARARQQRSGLWALPGMLDARTFRKRFRHCRPGSNSLRSR